MTLTQQYEEFCRNENPEDWQLCSEWSDNPIELQSRIHSAMADRWEPIGPVFWNQLKQRYEQRLKRHV